MIDTYLEELRRLLRFRLVRRGRLLAEVEEHLRESAAALRRTGLAPEQAEREAVERFGPPATVVPPARMGTATGLLLGAMVLYVLPLYGIPENMLPPAPWVERPDHLTWKLYAALVAFGVALPAGLTALVATWLGRARVAIAALFASAAALAVSGVAATVLMLQWAAAVPGSGGAIALGLPAMAITGLLVAGAVTTAVRAE